MHRQFSTILSPEFGTYEKEAQIGDSRILGIEKEHFGQWKKRNQICLPYVQRRTETVNNVHI